MGMPLETANHPCRRPSGSGHCSDSIVIGDLCLKSSGIKIVRQALRLRLHPHCPAQSEPLKVKKLAGPGEYR